MRTILFVSLFFLTTLSSFCQDISNQTNQKSTDYLKKSKDQNTLGWVLLGGGAALSVIGTAWNSNDNSSGNIFSDNFNEQAIMVLCGLASMVASIPVFISAGRNKSKSKKLSLNLNIEHNNAKMINPKFKSYPSVSFVIPIS
jgi:hypothetical protein